MNDHWTNRLSEYLDGELDTSERAALETHLETCGQCYATLAELRQVVDRAKALEDREPTTDLWSGIRARLDSTTVIPIQRPGVTRRRFSFNVPQLLAASIALALVSGGGVWMALRNPVTPTPTAQTDIVSPPPIVRNAGRSAIQTDMAIAELEETLARNEGQLDTATVRVVRQSLAVIDRAIGQAQKALRRDPGNIYLNLHLANTMRQKIELLRRANALASSES